MKALNGVNIVLSNRRYLALFIALSALFLPVYIFAWNMILAPNLYVRADLWTPLNILLLLLMSVLSSAALTMNAFNIKMRFAGWKKSSYGFLSFLPAFFTSACPTCAPLILSFASSTYGIGMALSEHGLLIRLISVALLAASVLYLSFSIGKGKCSINLGERHD